MPDPLRKTISATEASALFEVSPYMTPWMLYRRFANGEEAYTPEHTRMDWGKRLEPLILEQAAKDLKFEIRPNIGPDGNQVYVRNGLVGCTRDAEIYCPDRGLGVCEAKCVFDYRTWMTEWTGGNSVPRQYEIQVQTQMKVGAGETELGAANGKAYSWGVFAVWVAGEVIYFERKPVPAFWKALDEQAGQFFDDVKAGNEPEPFGSPREFPLLEIAFPIDEKKILDWREGEEGLAAAEQVRMMEYHRIQRLSHTKGEDTIKAKLRVKAKTYGQVLLPHGINFKLKQNKTGVGLKAYVPKDLPEGQINGQ